MNNQNAKAFSLDQTLNTSLNILLSMLREKEDKKTNNVQFTKIKKLPHRIVIAFLLFS